MSAIKALDIVKVVKVFHPDCVGYTQSQKKVMVGALFRVNSVVQEPKCFSDQCPPAAFGYFLCGYLFHPDELELVSAADSMIVPPIGSYVRVLHSSRTVQVHSIRKTAVEVVDVSGNIFEVGEVMSKEQREAYESQMAAEKKVALEKKRDELLAVAQKALQDAAEISTKLTEDK